MELLTLMMCAMCLWVKESFAKNVSKVFKCRKCGFKIDRDYNALHNIFLMHREAL
jgi:transposase